MQHKEITFDKFVRGMLIGGGTIAAFFVLRYLSAVLLPFALAWFFAYLLYPLVRFIENKLRIRVRALSIILAIFLTVGILVGILWLIIPPMVEQIGMLGDVTSHYVHQKMHIDDIPETVTEWVNDNNHAINQILHSRDFTDAIKTAAPKVFDFVGQTVNIVVSIIGSCITLLYMFFILMDYEHLSQSWINIFPKKNRPFWKELSEDVEAALHNYIRGQGMVAFIMGVLFCIGFTIIGFPMAIGLGVLIGILDMVPYLHTFALLPTAFLAVIKAADTGQSFWLIFGMAVAVFCIVQVIIDMVVTPKVMGKAMGLNPAILLLSLSIWGTLLGFIGLIIALPATTIIIAYWKRYVTHDEEGGELKIEN